MRATYRGRRRDGTAVVGVTGDDVTAFVEARFRAGWRDLEVTAEMNEIVGSITTHPDTGHRVWWALACR
jgi:hypothetical protein